MKKEKNRGSTSPELDLDSPSFIQDVDDEEVLNIDELDMDELDWESINSLQSPDSLECRNSGDAFVELRNRSNSWARAVQTSQDTTGQDATGEIDDMCDSGGVCSEDRICGMGEYTGGVTDIEKNINQIRSEKEISGSEVDKVEDGLEGKGEEYGKQGKQDLLDKNTDVKVRHSFKDLGDNGDVVSSDTSSSSVNISRLAATGISGVSGVSGMNGISHTDIIYNNETHPHTHSHSHPQVDLQFEESEREKVRERVREEKREQKALVVTNTNTYNIPTWGDGYVGVNEEGHVTISPDPSRPSLTVDLYTLVDTLRASGRIRLPTLVSFPQILKHRLESINAAFRTARLRHKYDNDYFLVYPIKVNQHRRVLDALTSAGEPIGLESGSKAEFAAVLAHSHRTRTLIVCNGYKDRAYIRLALMGERLGHKVYIVVEKMTELHVILDEAERLKVTPRIGVRARLSSHGLSKWSSSGGDGAKFGLAARQILQLVEILKSHDQLDCLQLIHFHLGSQMGSIRDITQAIEESGRFYVELTRLGANIKCFDVGGGLGVDYDGSRSQTTSSVNYSVWEYANRVVKTVGDICRKQMVPVPVLISESGRFTTAHHSVMVTNVVGLERYNEPSVGETVRHIVRERKREKRDNTQAESESESDSDSESESESESEEDSEQDKTKPVETKPKIPRGLVSMCETWIKLTYIINAMMHPAHPNTHKTQRKRDRRADTETEGNDRSEKRVGEKRVSEKSLLQKNLNENSRNVARQLGVVRSRSVTEHLNDAKYYLQDVHTHYNLGLCSLEHRAQTEDVYMSICHRIHSIIAYTYNLHNYRRIERFQIGHSHPHSHSHPHTHPHSHTHSHPHTHSHSQLWEEVPIQHSLHTASQFVSPVRQIQEKLLDELGHSLADKFYLNFSLFQGCIDAWGIGQLFPILPLSGLHTPLTRRAVLLDVTCDSDGVVKEYINNSGVDNTMPFPDYVTYNPDTGLRRDVESSLRESALRESSLTLSSSNSDSSHTHPSPTESLAESSNVAPPLIAFFLVGAYQEILGNHHNLFGSIEAVDVVLNSKTKDETGERGEREREGEVGEVVVNQTDVGDSVRDMLEYVNISPNALLEEFERDVHEAMEIHQRSSTRCIRRETSEEGEGEGELGWELDPDLRQIGQETVEAFRQALDDYTYLEEGKQDLQEDRMGVFETFKHRKTNHKQLQ